MNSSVSKAPPCLDTDCSDKQSAVIAAAERIFMQRGFHNASMDAIAREAGVSKQTIYNNFGNKEALFNAIAARRCLDMLSALLGADSARTDVEATLHKFAATLLDQLLEPTALAFHRLIIAESARFPEVGEIYYRAGPERGNRLLADYFDEQCGLGHLYIDDTLLAARQFTGALIGSLRTKVLVLNRPIPPKDIRKVVDYSVASFMCLHGKRGQV